MDKPISHWAEASEAGSVFGMKALLLIYQLFGRWGFRVILYPVMAYFFITKGQARRASRQYLDKVSDQNTELKLSSFKHFLTFGEIVLDKFLAWMGKIGKDDVVFEYPDEVAAFDQNTEGGVIVVSHLGNNEVCAALTEYLPKVRLTLLVYTQHAERFNRLITRLSGGSRIKMYQVTDMSPALAMILSDRVKAGEYIVIAGDRTPVTGQQRVSTVDFFNGVAELPQGAFILAGLLKCPVYLLFCLKQADKYHVYIEQFAAKIQIDRSNRDESLNGYLQSYASKLEDYCLKAPLQWFNFFPFWLDRSVQSDNKVLNAGSPIDG